MTKEPLSSFDRTLGEVALTPDANGGRFEIHMNDQQISERTHDGGFSDMQVLKQRERDILDPNRELGRIAEYCSRWTKVHPTGAWVDLFDLKYVLQKCICIHREELRR